MMSVLGQIYSTITQARNQLYDKSILSARKFNVPVVSIGNITAGGTGKTPMLQSLLEWSAAENISPGVVSRGYGGSYSGVQKVDLDLTNPAGLFGDEPVLTKNRYSHIPFYVGRKRPAAVEALISENEVDLIFADDAFQHRALHRDLDIVMLDATQTLNHYRPIPEGRLRESITNLARADFIVITRWNLASDSQKAEINKLIKSYSCSKLVSVVRCDYKINRISGLNYSDEVMLFSGIGNPDSFEKLVSSKASVIGHKVFKDHHSYTEKEINDLISGGKKLVTTEKDAVKLRALDVDLSQIYVAELGLEFDKNIEKLYEAIRGLTV